MAGPGGGGLGKLPRWGLGIKEEGREGARLWGCLRVWDSAAKQVSLGCREPKADALRSKHRPRIAFQAFPESSVS